jgi:hypothetical protein
MCDICTQPNGPAIMSPGGGWSACTKHFTHSIVGTTTAIVQTTPAPPPPQDHHNRLVILLPATFSWLLLIGLLRLWLIALRRHRIDCVHWLTIVQYRTLHCIKIFTCDICSRDLLPWMEDVLPQNVLSEYRRLSVCKSRNPHNQSKPSSQRTAAVISEEIKVSLNTTIIIISSSIVIEGPFFLSSGFAIADVPTCVSAHSSQ